MHLQCEAKGGLLRKAGMGIDWTMRGEVWGGVIAERMARQGSAERGQVTAPSDVLESGQPGMRTGVEEKTRQLGFHEY